MKKIINFIVFGCILITFSSCATVFGGKVGRCQRVTPTAGQPAREIRAGALIADLLFFPPGIFIDFMTCAIFKPCDEGVLKKP